MYTMLWLFNYRTDALMNGKNRVGGYPVRKPLKRWNPARRNGNYEAIRAALATEGGVSDDLDTKLAQVVF